MKLPYLSMIIVLFSVGTVSLSVTASVDETSSGSPSSGNPSLDSSISDRPLSDKAPSEQVRKAKQAIESLTRYNEQMRAQIERQSERLTQYDQALLDVATLERQLLPQLESWVLDLEAWVDQDLPFQKAERQARVAQLKQSVLNPSLSISEKYQLIIEAHQNERELGRELVRYPEMVEIDGQTYHANVLRVGRIALLCQTAEGRITARWNATMGEWERLEESLYRHQVQQGLKMVANQAPQQLLTLPLNLPAINLPSSNTPAINPPAIKRQERGAAL